MLRKTARLLLFGLYLALVTFGLLEVGVRIWGYSERHIHDPIYVEFDPDSDIPYVHKPNLANARARGHAIINTDSLGLRSVHSGTVYGDKKPDEYRIAIVGDSVTFGEGVPAVEDTFPQVLQDLLNAGKALPVVTVFNFGASAYSVKEMAATLEHRMAALRPDLVVMAIIPDDFNLARTPRADGYGYLVGQKARLTLDSPLGRVLRRVHLLYVLRDIIAPRLSTFSYRPSFAAEEPIPDSYRYLLRFRELAQQRGLEPLILLLPTFGGPTWGPLPRQLSLDGIQYLDVSAVADEFTTEERLASVFDPHASAAVHHRIGEELADWVRSRLGT